MRSRSNKVKAIFQDLAGFRLTVLMVLYINNRPMQNLELSDWIGKGDKPLAGYLDYLESHHYVERSFAGWKLCQGVRQLDFLKELGAVESETLRRDAELSTDFEQVGNFPTRPGESSTPVDKLGGDGQRLEDPFNHLNGKRIEYIKESEKFSDSENYLSTAPTTTTNHELSNTNGSIDLTLTPEKQIAQMDLAELKEIKAEIVKMCLGEHEAYQMLIDDDTKPPQFIFGHYLQLMAQDRHWNKGLLVDHILNRPVHPHHYKQACKMIANGDY